VPRDLADELGAFGAPDQCAEAVLRLCAAGAHRIALIAVGSDFEDQYATFARAALPAVRARQQLAAADE
jgi:alkanesulfonate monooxygenase SsuD/methylene tetrahydromethanopterin reductase-like flavin-dependent oxidoreductase (luciferase family)